MTISNELVINSTEKGSRIALLRNKNLVELHYDDKGDNFSVGDMYLGTVKKLVPGLNAAFIDIGYEKDAFLHYLDLGPRIKSLQKLTRMARSTGVDSYKLNGFKMEPEIEKTGKITEVLKSGQQLLVQVAKEPISTKGPRLSCELSLAGRYIILVPFSSAINVSKKIAQPNERKRLQRLISSIKPEGFGVIIRTVAEGKNVVELDKDLRDLLDRWSAGLKSLHNSKPPLKVIGEASRANTILRDLLNESFDSITVDSQSTYNNLKEYIRSIAPDKENIVKHYSGKEKIFEIQGIEKQMKTLFGQTVSLPKGGYLVIEHTEALHVVDVNSGNKSSSQHDQESTALSVNMEAATEVARQLRLRDMGGIIVIDFIDLRKLEHRKQLYEHMKELMETDRSKATVLPLSKFGLMQITRQRVRPEINITTAEVCPTCNGTGKIDPTIAIADRVESELDYVLLKQNETNIALYIHPYLHAYFTKGIMSKQVKWWLKYHKWIKLHQDSSLGLTEYRFFDAKGDQITLTS